MSLRDPAEPADAGTPRRGADAPSARSGGLAAPVTAGVVTALVGFTSSSAVVLAGLAAVGADHAEAASGLLALTVATGLATLLLSWRTRMPVTAAWSTPGAALLAASGMPEGGWPAAVGAFIVTGLLLVLTGLWGRLADLIARIPTAIAQAMLAGVLLPLCLAPVTALSLSPWAVVPVLLVWLVLSRLAPRWAVPAAFAVAVVVISIDLGVRDAAPSPADLVPGFVLTAPVFEPAALIGLALPLYLVTMASQNLPGAAVLASFGYRAPWRSAMLVTGTGTIAGAFAGGHAINLAAISAALAAGPDADPDPTRRWRAGVSAGAAYLVLAVASAAVTALAVLAPAGLMAAVAGLALLPTLAGAIGTAMQDAAGRLPAVVAFVVAASGAAVAGIGAAFWALVAGLVVHAVLRIGRRPA
ncbi:benzoate/H(+) symporter BenE family transporter [Agromyces seonyuensis]|uniref:Benzoate/H(+) symporter BenE family transporter n=1 Tax=Agromyces seonyuensis TaxID=2662446 RepID=A0A6I4NT39_9MICO|nr:benzoate/H(+) symporter BenE family transporter [Agromyces seonyuensis]MWB97608.1 benzoate/H(+) symporter BenE family transporter [Agromyces seonyuensis]